MRWTPGGRSRNVEDLRGRTGGGFSLGKGMGVGGTIIVLILGLLFGGDIFSGGDGGGIPTTATETGAIEETPEERRLVEFVSFVLDDAQRVWSEILPKYGGQYRDA